MNRLRFGAPFAATSLTLLFFAGTASATWAGGRTTPTLRHVVAIDATGENNWPYGAEDVAGDGLGSFGQQEQSIDIRTAYAATDAQRLWARVYVSDAQPAGGNVHAFVFIDSDRNSSTGGTAVAPEISPNFTTDPSPGGYEYVVEFAGNGVAVQLWDRKGNQYAIAQLPPPQAAGEAGTDADPIRIGALDHGYIQVAIDLGVVGLTQACDANLYFRTTNSTAALGAGDLDVGQVASCVPSLSNGVPAVLVPPNACTSNAGCPAGAVCRGGQCALAPTCTTNADCGAGMQCTADGRCVPAASGSCTTNAECNGLVCQGGQCVACTLGGSECGTGNTCGADGRCSTGSGTGPGPGEEPFILAADETIKGGACNCALPLGSTRSRTAPIYFATLALIAARRRSAKHR